MRICSTSGNWSIVTPTLLVLLAGCGAQTTAEKPANPTTTTPGSSSAATIEVTKGSATATTEAVPGAPAVAEKAPDKQAEAESANEPARKPATVAEAAKILDLRQFPLLENVPDKPYPTVATLHYLAKGETKSAFEFQRKTLLAQKWKELPDSYVTDQSASATFRRDGFVVSVSVFPGSNGMVNVSINNHGNVDPSKLPVPSDTKVLYAGPVSTMHITGSSVEDTATAVRKLLQAQGWQLYGNAGETLNFKQNAIELGATIGSAPAQGGKTVITYSSRQLSADLPCPETAFNVQYSEPPMQIGFDVDMPQADVVKFYAEALAKHGWEATTEKPINVDFRNMLIYRNPAKEYLEMNMHEFEGKTRVRLEFETAEEFAEKERLAKAAILAKLAKEKAEANKPKPKIAIALPAGAEGVEVKANNIEFTVPAGKAKAAVQALQKQLVEAGWKEESATFEDLFGNVMLKKDEASLTLTYLDSGVIAPEITITSFGIELEQKQ